MKKIIILLFLYIFSQPFSGLVMADDVSEVKKTIQSSMDDARRIVKDTSTNDEIKRGLLWKMILRVFDFEKITEFTLGKFSSRSKSKLGDYSNRRLSPEQHKVFESLFTQHLGNTYLDRIDFNAVDVDVKVEVVSAEMLKSKKNMKRARVNSIINDKTLIDYMMLERGEGWKIYDVKVEGRSMVSAFRKEYKTILIKNKPDYLIALIRGKVTAHKEAKTNKKTGDNKSVSQ